MNPVYIISETEGEGKTAMCAGLARKIQDSGASVAVFRPLAGEGLSPDTDQDADTYHALLGQERGPSPLELSGAGLTDALLDDIKVAFTTVSDGMDIVLVEGSCALSTEESAKLAAALDARSLVVTLHRRGLAGSGLSHWKERFGDRLVGFVVNGMTRYLGTETRAELLPSMESEGLRCFGTVPEDRRLLGVSVGQLAQHLEGRFVVCEEQSDALVEYLMVGGMGMDPVELYFGTRENKAVIVRGDRPDLQMGALNTETSCMVLTKGIEPIEYVSYEAEQEEVSVMIVETDTLSTMDAANTLMDRARFDHPLKLSRYAELLDRHVDLPALFSAMGLKV